MERIEVQDVEQITFALTRKLLLFDEPIPEFGTRFSKILESCIETPFQTHQKEDLYKGLEKKASILFYLMIKNHPFQNGNKRIAVMTLLWVLARERKWLDMSQQDLYHIAVSVAESKAEHKNIQLIAIEAFIKEFLVLFVPKS